MNREIIRSIWYILEGLILIGVIQSIDNSTAQFLILLAFICSSIRFNIGEGVKK
jgi:hypothetical protein